MRRRRFVILDRDGTIIQEREYLADPGGVELIPGAASAIRDLASLGLGLTVITNQSGVGRGVFDPETLDRIHERMGEFLANEGVKLEGIYVCPHHPDGGCPCRKPKLGLMNQAVRDHGFDPGESFVIGDKTLDIEFGKAAGSTTILVRTGYGAEVEAAGNASADYVVRDLAEAAQVIRQIVSGRANSLAHGLRP